MCSRKLITGLTSAASPRVNISSTCRVGQKLSLCWHAPFRRDHPGYCTTEVGNLGGTYELPCTYTTLWGSDGCGADKKLSTFYEVRKAITVYVHKRPPLDGVFSQISSAHKRPTSLRHVMTLSSHLYQRPWNDLTSWVFATKMFLCIPLLRVVCPVTMSSLIWWTNNVLFNVLCKHEVSHT